MISGYREEEKRTDQILTAKYTGRPGDWYTGKPI